MTTVPAFSEHPISEAAVAPGEVHKAVKSSGLNVGGVEVADGVTVADLDDGAAGWALAGAVTN